METYLKLTARENPTYERLVREEATPEEREGIMEITTSWMQQGLKQGLKEGRRQGLAEGREQGLLQGVLREARESVVDILKIRFGKLTSRDVRPSQSSR